MPRLREQTDWSDENGAQRARRQSAERTGRAGLANDALASALATGTPIRENLRSQSLTRRMDQARYAAQRRRGAR